MTLPLNTVIKTRFRTIDGLTVRCAESAAGGRREPTVLLTSPWPESMYAFAPIWASLAEHARLFAVDLPGFSTCAGAAPEGALTHDPSGEARAPACAMSG
jgi:hypothetical protein